MAMSRLVGTVLLRLMWPSSGVATLLRGTTIMHRPLGVVAEVAARGGKERHTGLLACVEVDCCVVCSFQDDHIGLRQAEVRMGRLAFHLEQHLRVLHFE